MCGNPAVIFVPSPLKTSIRSLSWGPGRSWLTKSYDGMAGIQDLKSQGPSGHPSFTAGYQHWESHLAAHRRMRVILLIRGLRGLIHIRTIKSCKTILLRELSTLKSSINICLAVPRIYITLENTHSKEKITLLICYHYLISIINTGVFVNQGKKIAHTILVIFWLSWNI